MPQSCEGSDAGAECRSCHSPLVRDEPILEKFQRCYYCGCHHPLGRNRTTATLPVMIAATAGLLAIWWTHLPS